LGAELFLKAAGAAPAPESYEAMGYITYTSFDAMGQAKYRSMMVFDAKVADERWRIRTAPVIEGKGGIGFYEAFHGTNDSVLVVTAFKPAYNRSQSAFEGLRALLKESNKDEVYFAQTQHPASTVYSDLLPPATAGSETTRPKGKTAKRIDNVAVATAVKGKYPPADPSYTSFVWFALTTPPSENGSLNGMLLQVWDDGNPHATRFRRAIWEQFPEKPRLVSRARYDWRGKQLLPDGTVNEINTSDVSDPLAVAAQYEVFATTNLDALVLPLHFKLTRFSTKQSGIGEPRAASTLVGLVVRVGSVAADDDIAARVPGKTFVSDYRLSAEEINGAPLKYVLDSNSPPAIGQIKRSRLYDRALRATRTSGSTPYRRFLLLALLLVPSLLLTIFCARTCRKRGFEATSFSRRAEKQ
jgi:hypothetical protein